MAGDLLFTQFQFPASGAPTARTMPDRLAEVKNVLDFGADPTNTNDSWQAIQNAINWTTGPNRGTIFFPLGIYQVSQALTFNYNGALSIRFRGEQGVGTNARIVAGFAGYVLDRSLGSPNNAASVVFEGLNILNGSTSQGAGCIRCGSSKSVAVRDCTLSGYNCFTAEDSPGNSSTGVLIESTDIVALVNGGGTSGIPGSTGVTVGGSGFMTSTDFVNCDVAVRAYGSGFCSSGNRIERCSTAYLFGLDSSTAATFTGSVQGATFTGAISGNTLTVSGVTGTIVAGQTLVGLVDNTGPPGVQTQTCTIVSGSGSTWTVSGPAQTVAAGTLMWTSGILTASSVTGTIKPGQQLLDTLGNVVCGIKIESQLTGTPGGAGTYNLSNFRTFTSVSSQAMFTQGIDQGASGFSINGHSFEGNWTSVDLAGTCSGFVLSSLQSEGHPAANAGIGTGAFQGTQYGFRSRPTSLGGVFQSLIHGQWAEVAGLEFQTASVRANQKAIASAGNNSSGGVNWLLPTNAQTVSFELCSIQPIWTFSQLPSGGNVFEGDRYEISDSTVNGFGNNVTVGGGSDNVTVRWNGTNWTVCGA